MSPKKARVQSRHTAASAGQSAAATLSHLLEDERKNGTRERDQSAPRPDYQYFQRNAFYVLCEDATGEYRTVIAREYERPRNGDYPEWPVLHETFLKPSASKFAPPPPPPAPPAPTAPHAAGEERPISGLPARQARLARLFKGVTGTDGADPNLRRSASLNNLGRASKLATLDDTRHPAAAENDGAYIAASGNSVNITSTTTSAQSGAGAGNTFDRQGREKAIAELNRKQVAFLPRAAAGSTASAAAASGPVAAEGGGGSSRPISTVVGEPSSVRKRKTKAAMAAVVQAEEEARAAAILEAKVRADHARRELKGTGKMDPPPMKKRHSLPADLTAGAKEKVRLPPREETKKPGYCENCRNKFDDFATVRCADRGRQDDVSRAREADLLLLRLVPFSSTSSLAATAALRSTMITLPTLTRCSPDSIGRSWVDPGCRSTTGFISTKRSAARKRTRTRTASSRPVP